MMRTTRNVIQTAAIFLGLSLMVAVANAGEVRFLTAMPTANVTNASAVIKSGKPGFECTQVQTGAHGNAVNVKGVTSKWFTTVGESEPAADDLIADGKKAIRCKMMEFNKEKHRMAAASL